MSKRRDANYAYCREMLALVRDERRDLAGSLAATATERDALREWVRRLSARDGLGLCRWCGYAVCDKTHCEAHKARAALAQEED